MKKPFNEGVIDGIFWAALASSASVAVLFAETDICWSLALDLVV